MKSIENTIQDYIARELMHSSSVESVGFERPLLDEGIIDSLGLQRLVAFLESTYGIEIDDEHLLPENFENILAISGIVKQTQSETSNES